MVLKNYIIKYSAYSLNGDLLKKGEVRAINKYNALQAQVKFEEHLKNKHEKFGKLIVHSCKEENPLESFFEDIFGI